MMAASSQILFHRKNFNIFKMTQKLEINSQLGMIAG